MRRPGKRGTNVPAVGPRPSGRLPGYPLFRPAWPRPGLRAGAPLGTGPHPRPVSIRRSSPSPGYTRTGPGAAEGTGWVAALPSAPVLDPSRQLTLPCVSQSTIELLFPAAFWNFSRVPGCTRPQYLLSSAAESPAPAFWFPLVSDKFCAGVICHITVMDQMLSEASCSLGRKFQVPNALLMIVLQWYCEHFSLKSKDFEVPVVGFCFVVVLLVLGMFKLTFDKRIERPLGLAVITSLWNSQQVGRMSITSCCWSPC